MNNPGSRVSFGGIRAPGATVCRGSRSFGSRRPHGDVEAESLQAAGLPLGFGPLDGLPHFATELGLPIRQLLKTSQEDGRRLTDGERVTEAVENPDDLLFRGSAE